MLREQHLVADRLRALDECDRLISPITPRAPRVRNEPIDRAGAPVRSSIAAAVTDWREPLTVIQ
ncbi:MAG: hypothetical protein M5T61_13540 [Acidimicrobiia bacterium]|nr:hypothetical protein [Acidimicrobiia bacterium]